MGKMIDGLRMIFQGIGAMLSSVNAGASLIITSVLTLLAFIVDGLYTLPLDEDEEKLEARASTKRSLGTFKILFFVLWIIASGGYFAKFLGSMTSLLVFALTVWGTSSFVHHAYDLSSVRTALWPTLKLIFGSPFSIITIEEGHVNAKSRLTPGYKIGGPGLIKVTEDSAVVLKRGRESRVIGQGAHFLRIGEKIQEVVDLRPQIRSGDVTAMTKDGFEVKITYIVGFQINTGGRSPSDEEPYPFSEKHVLKAVYASKQVGAQGAMLWHERVPGLVFGHTREMIATHYLEDFFEPENPEATPRAELKQWLADACRGGTENMGAQLNWVNFATPQIPSEATQKYIERWLTKLETIVKEITDAAEAKRMREIAESLQGLGLSDDVIARVLAPQTTSPYLDDLYGPSTTASLPSVIRSMAASSPRKGGLD
jgi:hypothetical protein